MLCTDACQSRRTEIILDEKEKSEESLDLEEQAEPSDEDADRTITTGSEAEISPVPESIFVDVCGAVAVPGVYALDADSRVFQAIEAAGGFLPEAASSAVNQAQPVSDGQQIYVPTQEEADAGVNPAADAATETTASDVVNINTADAQTLKTLSGIGDAKAQAILSYREEHGAFACTEDIMQVPGIKESTFLAIKDKIAVK